MSPVNSNVRCWLLRAVVALLIYKQLNSPFRQDENPMRGLWYEN